MSYDGPNENNEFSLEEPKKLAQGELPHINDYFPQVDPNQVENELIDQFKEMQENMPAEDVAAHFFQMYFPIYKQLLSGLSNKDLKRVAEHVVQWPLEDEHPKFHEEKAKQAFAVGIRLNDCKMIMKTFVEMERHKQIMEQKAKAEQEKLNISAPAAEETIAAQVAETKEVDSGK